MRLSCVPPVAASLIATSENILHIAPASDSWKTHAPRNIVFLPPTLTKQTLLIQIGLLRPSTLVVGDQAIDEEVINQWRLSHPFGDLFLVRRGSSLDKVRLDLCEPNHIRVTHTPGVNAPHVAAFIAHWLTLADGSLPHDVCVLGFGNVGKALVKLLLAQDPEIRIKVLVRYGHAQGPLDKVFCDSRVSFVVDWQDALQGACALAICLPLNKDTDHRLDQKLIASMHRQARLVCVAKPDVFSDDALRALAITKGIQLVLDYGPSTLDAFRLRTQTLGCSAATWCKPAMLTTQAATTQACHHDLDYAVSVQLSLVALRSLVRRKLAQSLTIPCEPPEAGAPHVSIIGRGINGLLQALMCRLANYHVTVYGKDQESDGASHKPVNMRHLSATETAAKPQHNPHLFPANQSLAVECNRAGIELFEKLLIDNPSLKPFAKKGIVRAYREHANDTDAAIQEQRAIEKRPWPSGKSGAEPLEISQQQVQARYGVTGMDRAIEVSGYDLEFRTLMAALVTLLLRAGIQFVPEHLSRDHITELSKKHFVVTAMGVEQPNVIPIMGWFFKLRAVGNEGANLRGFKLQYELPIGVMNCRLDGNDILVSGGQVPPDSAPAYKDQVLAACLAALARHFPRSYNRAIEQGNLTIIDCARPGTLDGLSIVHWCAFNRIAAGATYAGGTTQGLVWASLVQELLHTKTSNASGVYFNKSNA